MATAEQMKALLRSHIERDEPRFAAVAMQIAATEARVGHTTLAKELRDLLDDAKEKAGRRKGAGALIQIDRELADVLALQRPTTRLADMVLDDDVRRRLERVLLEHRQHHKLRERGFRARRKLMLIGPPGSGKTMTGAALAGELHLPLFTVVLEGLITRFLGETAAKLRLVFEFMARTPGVYLFDEFDAIGGQRALANDVGEIRRVLSSFLQLLEHDDSDSITVAATNNRSLLDPALFRRFDDIIEFGPPAGAQVITLMRNRLAGFLTSGVDWGALAVVAEGLSCADLTAACDDAAKATILADLAEVETAGLLRAIEERRDRAQRT